jgi:hypothetical protein
MNMLMTRHSPRSARFSAARRGRLGIRSRPGRSGPPPPRCRRSSGRSSGGRRASRAAGPHTTQPLRRSGRPCSSMSSVSRSPPSVLNSRLGRLAAGAGRPLPLHRRRTRDGPEVSSPIGSGRASSGPSCKSGDHPPMPSRSNAHPSGSVTSANRRPLSGWRPVKQSPCRPSGFTPPSGSSGT